MTQVSIAWRDETGEVHLDDIGPDQIWTDFTILADAVHLSDATVSQTGQRVAQVGVFIPSKDVLELEFMPDLE